jgi:hypothetical protein
VGGRERTGALNHRRCGGALSGGRGSGDGGSFGHYRFLEFGMEINIIRMETAHYAFAIALEQEEKSTCAIHGSKETFQASR